MIESWSWKMLSGYWTIKYNCCVQYKGEQIGQTILPDINLSGNSVDDPGCLNNYLAFQ
jgi:hypothetical protein